MATRRAEVGACPLGKDELLERCKGEHQSFQSLLPFGFYPIVDLLTLEKV